MYIARWLARFTGKMVVVTRILRVDLSHRARSGGRAGIAGSSLLLVVGVTGRHAVGNGEGAERLFEMGWIVLKWIGGRQEAMMDGRCDRSLGRGHLGAGGMFDQESDGRVEQLGEIADACIVCSTRLVLLQL